jgi:hypothetical protein
MAMSYGPHAAQMNEELPSESSLDLTLTQHPCDEDLELQEVHTHLKIEPPRAWYYCISLNFRTLMILLQVNPASGDELEIFCEGRYKIEEISISAWFSIPNVGCYRWLCGPIHRLPPNSEADYLIYTIQFTLNFLHL